mgnify:CR=1 FL=1
MRYNFGSLFDDVRQVRAAMPAGRFDFDPTINYYDVLDVPYTASKAEIARAYRELMWQAHPDHAPAGAERHVAEERAKLLNAAYAVLTKPDLRREYDQLMRKRAVNDALFQRYTGAATMQQASRQARAARPAAVVRQQQRASRAAFVSLLVSVVLLTIVIVGLLVVVSLLAQLVAAAF